MKKYLAIPLFFLSIAFAKAQDRSRIKGNRDVTVQSIEIKDFQEIKVGEELEVYITEGLAPKASVETDSNLHQFIEIRVINGVLTVRTLADIRRSKELRIEITYTPQLNVLTVFDEAEVSTVTDLRLDNLQVNVKDDARVFLTGRASNLIFNAMADAQSECNLRGEQAQVNLNGNTETEALLNYDSIDFMMTDRAEARIEGDASYATLVIEGDASLTAENLEIKDLKLNITRDAVASINVSGDLELYASGDSKVELHNNPQIEMAEFSGSAVLMKK